MTRSEHVLLPDNQDALAARLALISQAQTRLCVQTYLLHNDETGRAFLQALYHAADRGIQVDLLTDDLDIFLREDLLAAMAEHPRFSWRVFNPFSSRRWPKLARFFSLLWDHGHMGRRMHNKVFVVDERFAIVGGRNIGNAYFDWPDSVQFFDLDVLLRGQIVPEIQCSFDRFWQSPAAVPICHLRPSHRLTPIRWRHWQTRIKQWLSSGLQPLPDLTHRVMQFQKLMQHGLLWREAVTQFVADNPEKVHRSRIPSNDSPSRRLLNILDVAREQVILVSPYFVPRRKGLIFLRQLRRRGVDVQILTNSLAATDVPLVHGGYERYRRALLRCGARIFELQPRQLRGYGWQDLRTSHASLHAKIYVADKRYLFIGSFNLDPRSISINTECAVILDCSTSAEDVLHLFESVTKLGMSYEVRLHASRLQWMSREEEQEQLFRSEPHAGILRRLLAWLGRILPVEAQL